MHLDSFKEMGRVLNVYLSEDRDYKVVDIGSQLIVGLGLQKTYRDLMKPKWSYTGIDIVSGANVDLLMKNSYIPIEDCCIDVVLSGQCLEHCENPFFLVSEMARIIVPDGLIVIAAPFNQERHLEIDRWRFLPQGFKALFDYAGLRCIDVYLNQTYKTKGPGKGEARFLDCWGIGQK
jgi:SAM-dependent methyltransferase